MLRGILPVTILLLTLALSAGAGQLDDDILSNETLIAFAKAVARPTALAATEDPDSVKFILVVMKDGKPAVGRVALLPNNAHAAPQEFARGHHPVLMIHVHHEGMSQEPQREDAEPVRAFGIPSMIISSNGEKLFEVGVINGTDAFRDISAAESGPWQPFSKGT